MNAPRNTSAATPSLALLTVDVSTAIWLLRAIHKEIQWASEYSAQVPEFVAPLMREMQKAASSGQTRTNLGVTTHSRQTEHSEPALAVTYGEAARRLHISTRTLRRRIAAGHIKPIDIGSTKRIAVTELERITARED